MTGVSNATFIKAINEGIVKPQLVKGRKKSKKFIVGSYPLPELE